MAEVEQSKRQIAGSNNGTMLMTCGKYGTNVSGSSKYRQSSSACARLTHAVAPVFLVDRHRKTTLGCPPSSDKKLDEEKWEYL